ncbi:MAG: MarR family winged helix-turn-helix transcriptional regulator [Gemmatimonadota bacterium]
MEPHRGAAGIMAADCLCFRSRRAARAITRLYDEALRPLGIHATQLTLLNAIIMCGEDGAGMRRLAGVLAMDATTLSRNLRPLVQAKLVRLTRRPGDARVRVVKPTAAGERLVEAALPIWTDAHQRVVSLLGSETAAGLRDLLDAAARAADPSSTAPERSDDDHHAVAAHRDPRRVARGSAGAARRREGVHPRT